MKIAIPTKSGFRNFAFLTCSVEKVFGRVIASEAKQSRSLKTEIATAPSGPRNDNLLCFLHSIFNFDFCILKLTDGQFE